jgi:hypothetical protein
LTIHGRESVKQLWFLPAEHAYLLRQHF